MKELKEPEIKLFGRKIVLPENGAGGECSGEFSGEISGGDCDRCTVEEKDGDEKKLLDEEDQVSETKTQENDHNPEESQNQELAVSESDENPKTPPIDEDVDSENNPKSENDATDGPQKSLKKPDKILPCPRCNSMDTKFCYYNNYNVNQPRHFCKSCQRYWTAGGTMRNVPVGAGRRKNKNSTPQCRHITITEALQAAARADSPINGLHHPGFKPNGTVLSFGPDSPLCESMASALNLADGRVIRNGYHKNGENIDDGSMRSKPGQDGGGENGPKHPVIHNVNGYPFPVPCIPGVPWNYPWSSAVPIPAICPVPFYPGPYWNYNMPNTWNLPWLPANQKPTTTSSGPTSPLGKHSRNGELINPNGSENKERSEPKNNSESSIVIPKTLRMVDPEEAAKSSIWETLGIKYDSVSREGLFKALQPKKSGGEKIKVPASSVLQANPAALSRSISFQEGV